MRRQFEFYPSASKVRSTEPMSLEIDADARSLVGLGGMSVLQRLLEELAAGVAGGAIDPHVIVRWSGAAPAAAASLRTPPGIEFRQFVDGQEPEVVDRTSRSRLPGCLVLGPGAWQRIVGPDASALLARAGEAAAAGISPVIEPRPLVAVLGDPSGRTRITRALFASLGKSTDGAAARTINRWISTRLSQVLVPLGVTPNAISVVLLALSLVATWALTRGSPAGFVVGMVLFNVVSILDGCDGEVARVTYRHTPLGARLDTFSDIAGHLLFATGLGVGLARQPGLAASARQLYVIEGIATAAAFALTLLLAARFDRRSARQGHLRGFGGAVVARLRLARWMLRPAGWVVDLLRQDVYRWVWMALAILGLPALALHLLAFGIGVHLVALAVIAMREGLGRRAARLGEGDVRTAP